MILHNKGRGSSTAMKLLRLLALFMGAAGGLVSAAEADSAAFTGTVWAQGVSQEGGWYDAQKNDPYNGDADDLMCYAACAANQIAWWQNSDYSKNLSSSAPKDINTIWQTYVDSNQKWNDGGDPASAINWWISGVYAPSTPAEWERYYAEKLKEDLPLTLPATNGYYFDQYGLTSGRTVPPRLTLRNYLKAEPAFRWLLPSRIPALGMPLRYGVWSMTTES